MEIPTYRNSLPFAGSAQRAIDIAIMSLTPLGFRVEERTTNTVQLAGPGMSRSNQNSLVGASRITLAIADATIELSAELGAMARLQRFARLFPPVLLGVISIVLSTVFLFAFGPGAWRSWGPPLVGLVAIEALVWAFVGPMLARRIGSRVVESLETFLRNMAAAGHEV